MSRTLIVSSSIIGELWSDDPNPWDKLLLVYMTDPNHAHYIHASFLIECIDNYECRRRHWGHLLRVLQAHTPEFSTATYIGEYSNWLVNVYMESDKALAEATKVPTDPNSKV